MLALTALLPIRMAVGHGGANTTLPADGSAAGFEAAALQAAAEVYALNCAVCHGATGGGLAEARVAFPPDHRNCQRCHKQGNPVVMPLNQPIKDNDMFPIGDPPALYATDSRQVAMAGLATPDTLFTYVRATMPRYHPGKLTDSQYWLLTAHLLNMNGRDEGARLAIGAAVESGLPAREH